MENYISEQELQSRAEYVRVTETYGLPLKPSTFAPAVQKANGSADGNALIVLMYILDLCRPLKDEQGIDKSRWGGRDRIIFNSEWLADNEFFVTTRNLKSIREKLTRLGLVKFHTSQHSCWVEPIWTAIEAVVKVHPSLMPKDSDSQKTDRLDGSDSQKTDRLKGLQNPDSQKTDRLDGSDSQKTDYLDAQTVRKLTPLPSLGTSITSSSFGGRQEEDVEKSGEEAARHPSWSDTELRAMASELIEYGAEHGRPCSGPWADRSREAFADVVRDGHDPAVVGAAWRAYLATFGDDAKRASDLGHWLRSVDLKDRPSDYGDRGFDAVYAAEAAKARREDERRRVAAGGVPTPRFTHTSDGWAVSAEGVPGQLYNAVAPDATLAEAEAAWEGWWQSRLEQES